MAEIVQLEEKLEACLVRLKEEFGLCAVKAEFEAEGASFRELGRLRRWTASRNIALFLKIGGVEALRDIKDAFDLGVNGLIAPMVESPFGVVKFVGAVESIFGRRKLFKSINIETRGAVEKIDPILEVAKGRIDNITIGRTDLSRSYFDPAIQPDSLFILDLIESLSCKIQANGLTLTVGGGLTSNSISLFQQRQNGLENRVSNIETRKIVLPFEKMLKQGGALKESLHFEELYLRHKIECETWLSQVDRERLAKLKTRL